MFSIYVICIFLNKAIYNKDFPMLQGALLVIALSVIMSNFIADAVSIFVDPSQRRRS